MFESPGGKRPRNTDACISFSGSSTRKHDRPVVGQCKRPCSGHAFNVHVELVASMPININSIQFGVSPPALKGMMLPAAARIAQLSVTLSL
jgi:hypothetical protein